MTKLNAIVTTEWLEKRLDDPSLRVVDITTYLRQPGAFSGVFRTVPFVGDEPSISGALQADFYKGLTDAPSGAAFAINGTTMRLTLHPGAGNGGSYKFWSGRETYEEGHVPGAIYADINNFFDPNGQFPYTVASHEAFAEKAGELGIGEPGTHVVICDQGVGISFWASRLWWQLRLEGFDNVAVLEGGFAKWAAERRPVSSDPRVLPPIAFASRRRPELLVSTEEVAAAIGDPSQLIVDSLSPADYSGEACSYGGRGHIPTSVNVFCNNHTDPRDNTLLADDLLKTRLAPLGVLDVDRRVITYCGGGFGATWNALVLHHLGKTDVAVFDGSMFEWTADPTRPLETSL